MFYSILLTKKKQKNNNSITAIITTHKNIFLQLRHLIAIAFILLMQTGQ